MAAGGGKLAKGPTEMRKPPEGELWIHVDSFGKSTKRCWAVRWWKDGELQYYVTQHWRVNGPMVESEEWDTKGAQHPRAVVVVRDWKHIDCTPELVLVTT